MKEVSREVMEQITQIYLADNYMLLRDEEGQDVVITSPKVAFELVKWMGVLPQEHIRVLLLNTKHKVIGMTCASIGTVNKATVALRDVFRPAVRANAFGVILVHNHPSGDPTPSNEDVALTRDAVKAGELLGIKVIDHIIVGGDKYVSLNESSPSVFW
jgi:DNA repair protein RadC